MGVGKRNKRRNQMKKLINDFHNTEAVVRSDYDPMELSEKINSRSKGWRAAEKRMSRVWKKLCGIEGCRCENHTYEEVEK
jgi:hypothetical protein